MFIVLIDTNNRSLCSQLFTCKQCELVLSKEEKLMYGYDTSDVSEVKRFRSLCIDGTNAGTLDRRPIFTRDEKLLKVSHRMRRDQRFITSKKCKTALLFFFKVLRSRFRSVINGAKSMAVEAVFGFVLPTTETHQRCKGEKLRLSRESMACLRYLLRNESCFCSNGLSGRAASSRTSHTPFCRGFRSAINSSVSGSAKIRFLQSFISLEVREVDVDDDVDDTSDEEDNEWVNGSDATDFTRHETTYELRSRDKISEEEILDVESYYDSSTGAVSNQ